MTYVDTARISPELESLIRAELQTGERITWLDQPVPKLMGRRALPIVWFGIPWTAFVVFWIVSAGRGTWGKEEAGMFSLFPLFGLPFLVIGAGMLSAPYWSRRRARRSVYVLTDQRAIIFRAGWRRSMDVRSFEPEGLTDLQRNQHGDGSGDLIFAREIDVRHRRSGHRRTTDIGFLAIHDVKSVEDRVRDLARKRRQDEEDDN